MLPPCNQQVRVWPGHWSSGCWQNIAAYLALLSDFQRKHDAIQEMLDVSDELAWRLERGEDVDPAILAELMEFFRVFADGCHHSKEEQFLFPVLEEKGFPREGGPIGAMLGEHQEARTLIQQMNEAAASYSCGDAGTGRRWAVTARACAALLGAHMLKENTVLFPMAEGLLTGNEHQALICAFDALEEAKLGASARPCLKALAKHLLEEVFQGQP